MHGEKKSAIPVIALVLSCLLFVPLIPFIGGVVGVVALVLRRGSRGVAIAAVVVGFAGGVFVQGMLAAIAIPSFVKYVRRAKVAEVHHGLMMLKAGAMAAASQPRVDAAGRALPPGFPIARTDFVPAIGCCQQSSKGACLANPADWSGSPWKELRFEQTGPRHFFQWRYVSDGTHVEIEGRADLNCDGTFSSFKLVGDMRDDSLGGGRTPQFDPVTRTAPLE